ncbi:glycine cleavage system protein H [Lactiplantibacillus garii]|uniref:Glycine cleavage system protein H n=1 Tax=Lactiplantibacillus garii TaxID=2306423 RepID=A0A426D9P7_9LACO|nr:glycine cleavage system protein H [Lactiplantibacillus garii]RRK11291.1 glycine cleavage system protein H [Lactiplantibacillus garii]
MAKHESAWKQMFHFYRDEYREQHAPMLYGDVWLQTKSRQRLVLGLTDDAKNTLTAVTGLTLPTVNQHLDTGATLLTVSDAAGEHPFTTPFAGTVQKINADLLATPAILTRNSQKDNWLIVFKAD